MFCRVFNAVGLLISDRKFGLYYMATCYKHYRYEAGMIPLKLCRDGILRHLKPRLTFVSPLLKPKCRRLRIPVLVKCTFIVYSLKYR
jgi:hypothetical protein